MDLNRVILGAIDLFRHYFEREGIELVCVLGPEMPVMTADAGQLTQVLVNLVVNAVQAMPEGGKLVVKTLMEDRHAVCVVDDTGVGMSEEILDRLFVPFFTTKEVDQGTGLGVPVVHGIITAHGGTIFLDEIGETSLAMQVKLLRVLQDKEVRMVGDARPRKVDVRIIAATNKNPQSLIQSRAFREELYYRINVVTIEVPALRARGGDVLLLVQHFAEKSAGELGKPAPRFSERALEALQNYAWPGNARELENAIQRVVVMNDNQIVEIPDLPPLARFSALRTTGVGRALAEVEADHIRNVLANAGGNKTHAAQIIGINRKILRNKMQRYSLD